MSNEDGTPVTDTVENASADSVDEILEQHGAPADATQPMRTVNPENNTQSPQQTAPAIEPEADVLRAEAAKNLEGWQRTLAEFQNYKRRAEREQKDAHQKAALDALVKFLPVIDDFERAMESLPEELKANPWTNGITLIQQKFRKLLDEHDVTIIDPVGELFDPSRHEAVGHDNNSEHESGHVSATLQKGYACGERVLRPALVRVAS